MTQVEPQIAQARTPKEQPRNRQLIHTLQG